jgi:Spy/CpxP family protein refolding chaperone
MKSLLRPTLILALLALPLAAQSRPDGSHRAERISRALNLTETQKTSILSIRDKHRPELIQRRDAVEHARIDLRTALQDTSTPEARLRALYDKASAARFDLILAHRSQRMDVQAVLTPEQRAKAAMLRDRAQARMHERMGRPRMGAGLEG